MPKKAVLIFVFIWIFLAAMTPASHGFTLLTREQALKKVFPSDFAIEAETRELTGETLARVLERLGGNLVYFQEGSESREVPTSTTVELIFGTRNGVKKGVAIIDVQPGKWGPVEFITAIDINGRVRRVKVMSYQEIRGRPIAQSSFMNQYRGKTSKSALTVGRDIIGISGATISSRSATFAVKKAIVLYEELYLK